jgi:hypothetical protein
MRHILLGAAALAVVGTTMPAADAADRCDRALREWSNRAEYFESRDAERDAQREIDAAQRALRNDDDSRCLDHVERAFRIYDEDKRVASRDRRSGDRYDDRYGDRDRSRTEGSGGSTVDDIIRSLRR